jgi:hypothetical protein
MKHLAIFSVMLLLVFAPSCKWLREKGIIGKKDRELAALLAQQDSIRIADSIKKAQEIILENARLDSIRMAEEARREYEEMNRYNIIVGSFITPEYATAYSSEFASMGYKTKILKPANTRFELVSAESHQKLGEAVRRLRQFQDTVVFDAWIYIGN